MLNGRRIAADIDTNHDSHCHSSKTSKARAKNPGIPIPAPRPNPGPRPGPGKVNTSRTLFDTGSFGQRAATDPGPTGNPKSGPLVGIARLAATAPRAGQGKDVEFFRLPVHSVLNRVRSNRVGFEWSINPYRGCEFGCGYCYARYTHTYMELDTETFQNKIYVKEDAARALRRDLRTKKVLGTHIAIGTATDPYQPAEKQFEVTRSILETLLNFSRALPEGHGLDLSITTKSNFILRDLDLLKEIAQRNRLVVNMSIITINGRLARALEPRAPRPDLRLEAVRQLNEAGIPAGVFIMPILPGITDNPGDLEVLCSAAASVNARWLMSGVVFLMSSSQRTFFPLLEQKFPRIALRYRLWYRKHAYAPDHYRKQIRMLMRRLRAKYRLNSYHPGGAAGYSTVAPPASNTLSLFTNPNATQLAIPFAS